MAQRRERNDFFFADPLPDDIGRRSVRGGVITLSAQGLQFLLQLGATMVLARLLLPSDFGLIAMVAAVVGLVAIFKDAGLTTATIQTDRVTHAQVSTLFWINAALSFALMVLTAGMASPIAWFYGEPKLFGIALGYAVVLLLDGLAIQHQALLRRQMRFRILAMIDVLSLAFGVAAGILMAFHGLGYWSILGMHLGHRFSRSGLTWAWSGWIPGLPVRGSGVKSMVHFGLGLTGASLFNLVREQAPFLIIGKVLGSGPLAIFERAYKLLVMPLNHMMPSISAVALPALSRLANEPERIRGVGRKLFLLLSAVTVPVSVVGVLTAPELIDIILGSQWQRAAVIFAFLSPLAATQAVSSVAVWLLTACGKSRILLRFAMLNALTTVVSIAIGVYYSLEAAALAFSGIGLLLRTPLLYVLTVAHTPVSWADLLGDTGIFIIGGLLVGGLGLVCRYGVLELTGPSYPWALFTLCAIVVIWTPVAVVRGFPGMLKQIHSTLQNA